MFEFFRSSTLARPSWGVIATLLVLGIGLVGFGNGDRVLWKLTSHGATTPGVVLDVRSYRGPDDVFVTYVPKVAFRDDGGALRIMEVSEGSLRYALAPDQPVYVAWQRENGTIAIDVPFKRKFATSVVLSLLTAIGLTAWLYSIWLIGRRIRLNAAGMSEAT